MKAVDTSVAVAAFASWHEFHTVAATALTKRPALVAHCALETYSVLTRLPHPHRAPPQLVYDFLRDAFSKPWLALPARAHVALIEDMARHGVVGGAVYDALVARTAEHHKRTLLTLDARAEETYRRIGVVAEPPAEFPS